MIKISRLISHMLILSLFGISIPLSMLSQAVGVFVDRMAFTIFVLDPISHSFTMQQVLGTLTTRLSSIALTFTLIIAIVYLYSVIGFLWFR